MNDNHSSLRAAQERAAARQATDPRARRCHERLAELHRRPGGGTRSGLGGEDEPVTGNGLIIIENRPGTEA